MEPLNICKICGGIMFRDPYYPMDEVYFCPNCGHRVVHNKKKK